jgi:Na+-translocating ferredoxin:NAD+ oxidoreductase RnfA subunit
VVYVVPEIFSFLAEHPFEMSVIGDLVGTFVPVADTTVAVVVVVVVAVTDGHTVPLTIAWGVALSALLARLAIMPVAVARPTTAAARTPTSIDRMSTVLLRGWPPS